MMGDKIQAKKIAKENGLPVIEGSEGGVSDIEDAKEISKKIGFPVLIKAAGGGGGKCDLMVCAFEVETVTAVESYTTESGEGARKRFRSEQAPSLAVGARGDCDDGDGCCAPVLRIRATREENQ